MDTRLPENFDSQQVSRFLDKIAQDCDTELQEIVKKRDAEIARIRSDAHVESRRLFRYSAEQLDVRLTQERSRYLARVRSDLRRRQWELLVASQERILEAISARFHDAWLDPHRQWQWCRYWMEFARQQAGDNAIHIRLGKDALESVRARIAKALSDYPANIAVVIDQEAEPGICIEWGDCILDGRLASQHAAISDMVLSRLFNLLHQPEEESSR